VFLVCFVVYLFVSVSLISINNTPKRNCAKLHTLKLNENLFTGELPEVRSLTSYSHRLSLFLFDVLLDLILFLVSFVPNPKPLVDVAHA